MTDFELSSLSYFPKYNQIFSDTLRALYLADNDFEYLPPDIKQLRNLQIVSKE